MKLPLIDYRQFRLSRLNTPQFRHLKLLLRLTSGSQFGLERQEIQEILARCEMSEIYIVNPYECFLLMCLLTDCPLAVFSEIWEKSYEEGEEKN